MNDTLDEAIAHGQGVERPCRCPVHEDSNASASVNVIKGLWYCYACHASGNVDGKKKAPGAFDLLSMIEPDKAVRRYPPAWLRMFEVMPPEACYWGTRFSAFTIDKLFLGEDPFTGQPTFPVYTPGGYLAGVGRRALEGEVGPKYRYPYSWAASRVLGGYRSLWWDVFNHDVLVLTEGYADMAAVREAGVLSLCCFGAGLHLPQLELVHRINPKVIITGFDMDEAGVRATANAREMLQDNYQVATAKWDRRTQNAKDPGDLESGDTLERITEAVARTSYDAAGFQAQAITTIKTMTTET